MSDEVALSNRELVTFKEVIKNHLPRPPGSALSSHRVTATRMDGLVEEAYGGTCKFSAVRRSGDDMCATWLVQLDGRDTFEIERAFF